MNNLWCGKTAIWGDFGLCLVSRRWQHLWKKMYLSPERYAVSMSLKSLCHSKDPQDAQSWDLYLPQYNTYGIHLESMESMLAETTANSLFHGHHGFHVEWSWNGQFHMESITIPWNRSIWIPWNSPYGFYGTSSYGFYGTNSYGINVHYTIRIHINSTRNYWIHS